MGNISRRPEIDRRRSRKAKLILLRSRYAAATMKDKKEILEKAAKLAPWISEEQFIASSKQKAEHAHAEKK